jgi:hypothetical protein
MERLIRLVSAFGFCCSVIDMEKAIGYGNVEKSGTKGEAL